MKYKISLISFLLFTIVSLILPEQFSIGFLKTMNFVPNLFKYLINVNFNLDTLILELSDSKLLFLGFIFYSVFSFFFVIMAFYTRYYEGEDQNTLLKTTTAFIILLFAIISIFSAIINKVEYNKIINYNEKVLEIEVNEYEVNNELITDFDNAIQIKEVLHYEIEKDKIKLETIYNDFQIIKIKINTKDYFKEYKKILKERYKYKLKFIEENKTRIKEADVKHIKYKLSGLYNIDYIIRVNKEIYVINFELPEYNSDNFKMVNNFLINSIYIQRGKEVWKN